MLAELQQHRLEIEGAQFAAATQLAVAVGRAPEQDRLETVGSPPEPTLPDEAEIRRQIVDVDRAPDVVVERLRETAARPRDRSVRGVRADLDFGGPGRAERGPALVNHEMAQRRVVVGFNVRSRDLGSVVEDAQALLEGPDLERSERALLVWGGQYESLQSAKSRLNLIIPAVIFLMLALLLTLFRRLAPALMILLNVPFAAVGGMIALYARGLPLSVSAMVGFTALSGIAVLNGVVLVTVVVSGLVTSTRLTLVVLPAIVPPILRRWVTQSAT